MVGTAVWVGEDVGVMVGTDVWVGEGAGVLNEVGFSGRAKLTIRENLSILRVWDPYPTVARKSIVIVSPAGIVTVCEECTCESIQRLKDLSTGYDPGFSTSARADI